MRTSRVGGKSKNANRVDSFIWHLGVIIFHKNEVQTVFFEVLNRSVPYPHEAKMQIFSFLPDKQALMARSCVCLSSCPLW